MLMSIPYDYFQFMMICFFDKYSSKRYLTPYSLVLCFLAWLTDMTPSSAKLKHASERMEVGMGQESYRYLPRPSASVHFTSGQKRRREMKRRDWLHWQINTHLQTLKEEWSGRGKIVGSGILTSHKRPKRGRSTEWSLRRVCLLCLN